MSNQIIRLKVEDLDALVKQLGKILQTNDC